MKKLNQEITLKALWRSVRTLGIAVVSLGAVFGALTAVGVNIRGVLPVTNSAYAEAELKQDARIDQNTLDIFSRELLNFRRERRVIESQISGFQRRSEQVPAYLLRDQADVDGQVDDLSDRIKTLRNKLNQ